MADVVDPQTNQVMNIPQDQANEGLLAGKYNFVAGQPVNVVDADGNLQSLPSEQVHDALSSGQFKLPAQTDITNYQNKQEYGERPVAAGAAGAARAATFGLSDVALTKSGLVEPETLSQLQQQNPGATLTGEAAGIVGPFLVPGGPIAKGALATLKAAEATGDAVKIAQAAKAYEAAKATLTAADLANPVSAVSKIGAKVTQAVAPEAAAVGAGTTAKILNSIGKVGAKTLGSAVEGTVYGAGQAISENALGDADLNAENLLHNVGYGALYAGALGGVLGLGGEAYKGAKGAFGKDIQTAALKDTLIDQAAANSTAPKSLADLAERNRLGAELGFETDLPQKARLLETNQILAGDSNFPAHGLQVQSLEDPYSRKYYKTFLESGDAKAKDLLDYEAYQKQEGVKLADKYIQDMAPEASITSDAADAGKKAVNQFEHAYSEAKTDQAPFWEKFDKVAQNEVKDPNEILTRLHDSFPDTQKYVSLDPEGHFIIPRKATMPFNPNVYGALKDTVEALNEPNLKISELRDLRKNIRSRIDPLKGEEAGQLSQLGKSLMDIMQDRVNRFAPDLAVREEFKKYAINEQNKAFLERDVFRGKIGDKHALGKGISYEDVVPRFFADSDTVRAAKAVLGPEQFNEITANYLSGLKAKATDLTKGFSSAKFARSLQSKAPELQEALDLHPDSLQKLQAVTDKMRILPDSAPANPSGTASTTSILQKIESLKGWLTPSGIATKVGAQLGNLFDQGIQRSHIDKILAGEGGTLEGAQQKYSAFTRIERMGQKLTSSINRGISSAIEGGEDLKGLVSQKLTPDEQRKKYDKVSKKILDLSANFETHVDALNSATESLAQVAPDHAGSVQMAAGRATQFLASKLPAPVPASPLSEPHQPSQSEIAGFMRYYNIVEKPLGALQQVKDGTLTKETIETLTTVYPKIYNEMKLAAMDQITGKKASEIPYQTRLMLSLFTGQDLDSSLKPANIMAAQASMHQSSQPPKAPQPGPKTTTAGLAKITKSDQSLTAEQRIEHG